MLKIEEIFQIISSSVHACEHSLMTWKNLRVLKLRHCLFIVLSLLYQLHYQRFYLQQKKIMEFLLFIIYGF